MKKIFIAALLVLFTASLAYAGTKGSVKKSRTHRNPHIRTFPNNTKLNNWSTKGNTNPYTGNKGIVNSHKVKINKKKN